jgi:nicotinamide-nucleotide amidase
LGTVWIAWATPDSVEAVCERFDGDRERVRMQTVERALRGLLDRL